MSVPSIHDFATEKHKSVLHNQNKDLSYHGVSKITSKPDHHRTSQQLPQTDQPSLAVKEIASSSSNSNHIVTPANNALEMNSPEGYEQSHQLSDYSSHNKQVKRNLSVPQTTRSYITPSNLSVIEITAQPRVKPKTPQSFRKTTKPERMQQYYKHIQTKYSDRTSLEPPKQRTSTSSLSHSYVEGNGVDFVHRMDLATPRAPTERIGNFLYPNKALQNPESSSGRTSGINSASDNPTLLLEVSAAPKHHSKFSGNSLPKWNQLYKAYHPSSK